MLISILLLCSLLFFLLPYADKNDFFNENTSPHLDKMIKYLVLSIPFVAGYIIFFLTYIERIDFIRSLNYPLLVFNVYFGVVLCLLSFGGALMWVIIPSVLIPLLSLPASLIYGVMKDIQYIKKYIYPLR